MFVDGGWRGRGNVLCVCVELRDSGRVKNDLGECSWKIKMASTLKF